MVGRSWDPSDGGLIKALQRHSAEGGAQRRSRFQASPKKVSTDRHAHRASRETTGTSRLKSFLGTQSWREVRRPPAEGSKSAADGAARMSKRESARSGAAQNASVQIGSVVRGSLK